MEREETMYNIFIGKTKDNTYNFLEYSFKNSETFKWLTGYELEFLTEDELDDRWNDYDFDYLWRDAVQAQQTELWLDDWVEQIENFDWRDWILDNSFGYKDCVEEAMEMAKKKDEVEYEYTNCIGCGRHFNEDNIKEDYYEWFIPENLKLLQDLYDKFERNGEVKETTN